MTDRILDALTPELLRHIQRNVEAGIPITREEARRMLADLAALREVAEAARAADTRCEPLCITFPPRHERHVGRCGALRAALAKVPT